MGASEAKIKAIPMGDSPQDRARRFELFKAFDVNGNKFLSLAEIDKGIRDVLELPQLFDTKPVIMRAYQAAKGKIKGTKPYSDDYVSMAEFRYLLIYLRQYYTLWTDFQTIEQDGDRRISENEFVQGAPYLDHSWGIRIKNPQEIFKTLLKKYNAQANITFTEFCDWAIAEHLKLHRDIDDHKTL